MFQPQPTPYSPFSSNPYGTGPASPAATFPRFQPSVRDSRGPTTFRDPIFSPAPNVNVNVNGAGLTFANNNNLTRSFKMAGAGMHDLEAQEAMARDFQPALEVGGAYVKRYLSLYSNSRLQGPLVGEKKSSHAITEEYAKADPIYVAKTSASISLYARLDSANKSPGITAAILALSTYTW